MIHRFGIGVFHKLIKVAISVDNEWFSRITGCKIHSFAWKHNQIENVVCMKGIGLCFMRPEGGYEEHEHKSHWLELVFIVATHLSELRNSPPFWLQEFHTLNMLDILSLIFFLFCPSRSLSTWNKITFPWLRFSLSLHVIYLTDKKQVISWKLPHIVKTTHFAAYVFLGSCCFAVLFSCSFF